MPNQPPGWSFSFARERAQPPALHEQVGWGFVSSWNPSDGRDPGAIVRSGRGLAYFWVPSLGLRPRSWLTCLASAGAWPPSAWPCASVAFGAPRVTGPPVAKTPGLFFIRGNDEFAIRGEARKDQLSPTPSTSSWVWDGTEAALAPLRRSFFMRAGRVTILTERRVRFARPHDLGTSHHHDLSPASAGLFVASFSSPAGAGNPLGGVPTRPAKLGRGR